MIYGKKRRMNERIKILIENFENICGRNEFLKKLEIYFSENFNNLYFDYNIRTDIHGFS